MTSPDAQFSDPVLAQIYDDVDGSREDLDLYLGIAVEFGARSVLDVGCGTGSLAIRLAAEGHEVTGVDPAAASIAVARAKPGAADVRWVVGDATGLPDTATGFDLAVMTGNVAQVFVRDDELRVTLTAIRERLGERAAVVFETRDPGARAWERWSTGAAPVPYDTVAGPVAFRREVIDVDETAGLVTFRATYRFTEGAEHFSTSTLRFRDLATLESDLAATGLRLDEVRDAPDRPGLEFVIVARPDPAHSTP